MGRKKAINGKKKRREIWPGDPCTGLPGETVKKNSMFAPRVPKRIRKTICERDAQKREREDADP